MAILDLVKKEEINTITINEHEINVKQYLPIEEKLTLVSNVLTMSVDDNNFANPLKVEVFTNIELIRNYTDIVFTEEDFENPAELYDLLETNNVINTIVEAIPAEEYSCVVNAIEETISAYYTYKQSAYSILDSIQKDYNTLDLDTEKIKEQLDNPDNLAFLKEITDKLG